GAFAVIERGRERLRARLGRRGPGSEPEPPRERGAPQERGAPRERDPRRTTRPDGPGRTPPPPPDGADPISPRHGPRDERGPDAREHPPRILEELRAALGDEDFARLRELLRPGPGARGPGARD